MVYMHYIHNNNNSDTHIYMYIQTYIIICKYIDADANFTNAPMVIAHVCMGKFGKTLI